MVGWGPQYVSPLPSPPPFQDPFLSFLCSYCQKVQLEFLFSLLLPLTCGSFLFTPLSLTPPADTPPVVTRGSPVHHLKGTFVEIFEVRKTSKRATHRVLDHWHYKSTLERIWEGWGERESPRGFRVPSNRGLFLVTLGLGSQ